MLNLGNTVAVTENNTDLRRGGTLLGELADLLNNLLGGGLEPGRGSTAVGESGGRNALSLGVKTTHSVCVVKGGGWLSKGGVVLVGTQKTAGGGCRGIKYESAGVRILGSWVT